MVSSASSIRISTATERPAFCRIWLKPESTNPPKDNVSATIRMGAIVIETLGSGEDASRQAAEQRRDPVHAVHGREGVVDTGGERSHRDFHVGEDPALYDEVAGPGPQADDQVVLHGEIHEALVVDDLKLVTEIIAVTMADSTTRAPSAPPP